MAEAMMPASSSPEMPAGRTSTMNVGKIWSPVWQPELLGGAALVVAPQAEPDGEEQRELHEDHDRAADHGALGVLAACGRSAAAGR